MSCGLPGWGQGRENVCAPHLSWAFPVQGTSVLRLATLPKTEYGRGGVGKRWEGGILENNFRLLIALVTPVVSSCNFCVCFRLALLAYHWLELQGALGLAGLPAEGSQLGFPFPRLLLG